MLADLTQISRAPTTAQRMAEAANRFLDCLSDRQRAVAAFPFAGDERYFWHYTPVPRNGLLLKHMRPPQRERAFALLDTGLGPRARQEVRQIIALEPILDLAEIVEQLPRPWPRDEEMYWFSVFGTPGGADPWAWRVGGHHIGLHFTVVDRELVACTPLFLGANPATVRHGPHAGLRTLAAEEELARELLRSLDPAQKTVAIVDPVAPDDILTRNYRYADPAAPLRGLSFAAMTGEQRERLVRLIRHYVERAAEELASNEWARIERAGLEPITFAWAGPEERAYGNGHYYAVVGPTFAIEYDNTQNNANHIHTVWRDFRNDWGEDLLAAHYAAAHRG